VKEGDIFRKSMVQHEMKHKRMRAQTIFSATGGLEGDVGNKLRQWMRDHKEYEDSQTLDPKAVCEARGKRILHVLSASFVGCAPVHRNAEPLLRTSGRWHGAGH
jgi:hypothetical protein